MSWYESLPSDVPYLLFIVSNPCSLCLFRIPIVSIPYSQMRVQVGRMVAGWLRCWV